MAVAEAVSGIPQLANTWNDSSFDTYTFDYQWTIRNVETRLALVSPEPIRSPHFCPDIKVKGYKTKWQLSFGHRYGGPISLKVNMIYEDCIYARIPSTGTDIGLWAVIRFSALKPHTGDSDSKTEVILNDGSGYKEVCVQYVPSDYDESSPLKSTVNIPYKTDIGVSNFATLDRNFVSSTTHDNNLTLYCKVNVLMLSDPKHKLVTLPPPVVKESVFDLGQRMEEARKNNLFTDVTLVAGSKEFKVHRAVLASQSALFKTKFELSNGSVRVKITDVPSDILEAMISFTYTGKVSNIDKHVTTLLEAAASYGMVGLRQHCERVLAETLNNKNVIENIVLAHTHGADQLKIACMSCITKNPSETQKTERWKSLRLDKENQELRMEILDAIAESLVK